LSFLHNECGRILRRDRNANTYTDGNCDTDSHNNFNSTTYSHSQEYADTEASSIAAPTTEFVIIAWKLEPYRICAALGIALQRAPIRIRVYRPWRANPFGVALRGRGSDRRPAAALKRCEIVADATMRVSSYDIDLEALRAKDVTNGVENSVPI
jgi:hypothetical protein